MYFFSVLVLILFLSQDTPVQLLNEAQLVCSHYNARSEVPGGGSLRVHQNLLQLQGQAPLTGLFPDALELDHGAYLTRAQIQLLEINGSAFGVLEEFASVKPCHVQLCAHPNRVVFSEVCKQG